MIINIATSHRFHLLDLARELANLGHEVRFYSYVPTNRAIKFGLKKECSFSFFIPMLPFLALITLSKSAFWAVALKDRALDFYLSLFMRPCDLFIALGTVYKNSITVAKKKYGAITILEWGSKHIEEVQRILKANPYAVKYPEYFTIRALQGYEIADYISIPSDHVKKSFIKRGVLESKLIQNPYGVDLAMFKPTEIIKKNPYDIITVGTFSYQKGSDLLIKVCRKNKFTLLHVGALDDIEFPNESNFTHVDPVDQSQLINYYAQARIFVLPSRQEGLAMVQIQAISCGLPIVCSMDTGGRDLRKFLMDKKWVIEMQKHSVEELEKCIFHALDLSSTQRGLRSYSDSINNNISWSSYGERYNKNLKMIS